MAMTFEDVESISCKQPLYQEPSTTRPLSLTPSVALLGVLDSKALSCLPYISFGFMLYSSGNAIYKSKGDPGTVAFVVSSFTILALLFWSMREFEGVKEKNSPKKERLKVAIWILAMSLNGIFSYRVTMILDSVIMSIVVWFIAAFTAVTGAYLLFVRPVPVDAVRTTDS